MLDHFVKTHPNLEHLQVDFNEDEAVNNYVFKVDSKLLTLKSLIFATRNVTTGLPYLYYFEVLIINIKCYRCV